MTPALEKYLTTTFEANLAKYVADREVWTTVPYGHDDYTAQIAEARVLAARYDPQVDPSITGTRWVLDCKSGPAPTLKLSQALADTLEVRG